MSLYSPVIHIALAGILISLVVDAVIRIRAPRDIPIVRSVLPFGSVLNGLAFFSRRTSWLSECRKHYGDFYMFNIGWQNIAIVSTKPMLKVLYGDGGRSLGSKELHFRILSALGSRCKRDLLDVPVHDRFIPSIGHALSKSVIARDMAFPVHRGLLFSIHQLTPLEQTFCLSEIIGKTLYGPLTTAVFGPSFPLKTYDDYLSLDAAIPTLMGPMPFTAWSGIRARSRLLKVLASYIQETDQVSDVIAHAIESCQSCSLPLHEQAVCLLGVLWALHTNLQRTVFWVVAFILVDQRAFERLRTEIHQTIAEKYGGKVERLVRSEGNATLSGFPLVDSAIKESMRMSGLSSSMRTVDFDTNFPVGMSSFVLRRGDLILGDTRAVHYDDDVYPDASTYKVDRFLGIHSKTLGIHTWGGGANICRGRFLAKYAMKLWLIIFLETYDLESEISKVPKMDPRSWNSIADPSCDIIVSLRRKKGN
ncbi:cytochrome P450 [Armillaria luteobubalina]|uniref:Cytochrome P450 n=1 Tax=Armillaria luteobubalina TaxID=153913 RepID=A0AA39UZC0_9AGAR|nr:cytochrome P450 [Armillaria luteobubalina]